MVYWSWLASRRWIRLGGTVGWFVVSTSWLRGTVGRLVVSIITIISLRGSVLVTTAIDREVALVELEIEDPLGVLDSLVTEGTTAAILDSLSKLSSKVIALILVARFVSTPEAYIGRLLSETHSGLLVDQVYEVLDVDQLTIARVRQVSKTVLVGVDHGDESKDDAREDGEGESVLHLVDWEWWWSLRAD